MDDIQILKYLKGETTPQEKKMFLDWIDESDENMAYYRNIRELWDMSLLTGDYTNINNEEAFIKIKSEIFDKQENEKPRRRSIPGILINIGKIAAVAIIAILVSQYFYQINENKNYVGYNNIEVPIGDRVKILLPDGSTVWLNSGTRISYPEKFTGDQRIVTLNGEAQFEVTKNEKKPFVVETSHHSVKVLGTVFNVYAYNNSDLFEATLLEGSIWLENKDNKQEIIKMRPGQQAIFDKATHKMIIHDDIKSDNLALWISGYFSFDKIKFSEMLERLGQYYNKKIEIRNSQISDYECTGKFKSGEPLEHILNVVNVSKPFKYKITEKHIIIY
ncbi:FecR family protein [Dysgonomonas sp. Marseille-P4677]|uniref:FecR family protein n=1 Tax=Dysgonomonas sp. Marseille-P4677 TaxID=2364790 RepID=UPI0019128331|nr:FecR family protein [Dysgonomonas sp. Marseille-P4677]MBK5721879.1 FecR family protein [Dysgonomonas sp. Marseille-P4677]